MFLNLAWEIWRIQGINYLKISLKIKNPDAIKIIFFRKLNSKIVKEWYLKRLINHLHHLFTSYVAIKGFRKDAKSN